MGWRLAVTKVTGHRLSAARARKRWVRSCWPGIWPRTSSSSRPGSRRAPRGSRADYQKRHQGLVTLKAFASLVPSCVVTVIGAEPSAIGGTHDQIVVRETGVWSARAPR